MDTIDRLVRMLDEERTARKEHGAFNAMQMSRLTSEKVNLQNDIAAARRERDSYRDETNLWEAKIKEWEAYANLLIAAIPVKKRKDLPKNPGYPDWYIPF